MSLVISASQTTQRSHLLTLKKCSPLGIIMSTYKRTISVVTTFPFHHSNNCFCFSTFSNSCVHVTYFFVQNRQMSVIHQHYRIHTLPRPTWSEITFRKKWICTTPLCSGWIHEIIAAWLQTAKLMKQQGDHLKNSGILWSLLKTTYTVAMFLVSFAISTNGINISLEFIYDRCELTLFI